MFLIVHFAILGLLRATCAVDFLGEVCSSKLFVCFFLRSRCITQYPLNLESKSLETYMSISLKRLGLQKLAVPRHPIPEDWVNRLQGCVRSARNLIHYFFYSSYNTREVLLAVKNVINLEFFEL